MRPEVKELYLFLSEIMNQAILSEKPKISVEDFVNKACILCAEAFYLDSAAHKDTPFNYFASASFGISEYPCHSLTYRIKYLKELTSFASLYADRIAIKCPFEAYISAENYSDAMWNYIIPEIASILVLEPLADMDLLSMTFEYFMLDSAHKKYVVEIENILSLESKNQSEQMKHSLMNQTDVRLGKFKSGEIWIKVEGPDNYIFEGVTYLHGKLPRSLSNYAITGKEIKVSRSVKEEVLSGFVEAYCRNAFLGKYNSLLFGTTFLTPIDVEVNAFRGNSEIEVSEFDFVSRIPHHLTYLRNITPYQMIEFRQYEGEAFESYREHMVDLMSKVKSTSIDDIDTAIKDYIKKDVDTIEKAIKNYKIKAKQDFNNELVAMGIYVVAGMSASTIDPRLGALASIFSVPTFAQKIVEKTRNLKGIPDTARSSNYFLWALKNTYVKR